MDTHVNILILNFNGKDLLEKFLSSIVDAAKKSRYLCRVSVIDNVSTDESVAYVRQQYPQVTLFTQKKNRVLCSYNDVIKIIDDDIVILLNNDIRVEESFVDPLVETIVKDDGVFMAAPKVLDFDGKPDGSNTIAKIKYGLFWASAKYKGYERAVDVRAPTFSSGMGAFDRKKFLALDGYDDLYLPGTLEDSDICFRAWKRGWQCIYQPKSVIYHMGQVSFHRVFGRRNTEIINCRNSFLFLWKNITDSGIVCEHIFFMPFRLLYACFFGKTTLVIGFWRALKKLPQVLQRRRVLPATTRMSDQAIFLMFKE
jgi:N-acetylglucosaminyl-diphospho-decaprenol L-rhamnosyltransferase